MLCIFVMYRMILSKQRSLSNLYFSMLISTDSAPLSHYTCNWCKSLSAARIGVMLLSIRQLKMLLFCDALLCLCDALLNRLGWYIEKGKGWIPACAEERHSYCREILVRSTPQNAPRIEKKCSGVLKRNARGP